MVATYLALARVAFWLARVVLALLSLDCAAALAAGVVAAATWALAAVTSLVVVATRAASVEAATRIVGAIPLAVGAVPRLGDDLARAEAPAEEVIAWPLRYWLTVLVASVGATPAATRAAVAEACQLLRADDELPAGTVDVVSGVVVSGVLVGVAGSSSSPMKDGPSSSLT